MLVRKATKESLDEPDWAVNRIGYNWTTLAQTDGTPVVMAGNIWSTSLVNLLSAPTRDSGNTANLSTSVVLTATSANGVVKTATDGGTCATYTNSYSSDWNNAISLGTSGSNGPQWMDNGSQMACWNHYYQTIYMYCIEQ